MNPIKLTAYPTWPAPFDGDGEEGEELDGFELEGEGGEGEEGEAPEYFIGEMDVDSVLDVLTRARELPDNINAIESRLQGNLGQLQERLETFAKGIPTQSSLDVEKLQKGLEAYDPKLAEVLGPLLQDAFKTAALDDSTLQPHLDPVRNEMREWMGQQLVLSAYTPEAIAEIVPPVKDGKFMPEGERHEDFINWYSKQGYQTQQALLSFGAPYVQALRAFERWESKQQAERADKAGKQTQRLQNGQVPSSRSRTPAKPKQLSPKDSFAAGFNEAFEEVKR